jgi:alpha-beta hydrolase superfamily lysophospholipase
VSEQTDAETRDRGDAASAHGDGAGAGRDAWGAARSDGAGDGAGALAAGVVEALVSATSAAAAACVGAALLWVPQERLVFQPPRPRARHRAVPDGAELVDYAAADGQPLFGYVVRPPAPGDGAPRAALVFHGNAELARDSVPWAREAARRTGHTLFVAEYRGYAGLPGTPSYAGSRLDAQAAHDAACAALGVRGSELALFGHSLGSAVAAELAAARPPRSLVLQSPFTSARAMARMTAAPLARWWERLARVHFDTAARVAALDVPVWVAHGGLDLIVPPAMGRAVHARARRPGELLVVPLAGHNNVARVGDARYWTWLARAVGA